MRDSVHGIATYFSHRAARYRASQESCPLARTLDLLPYAYALQYYVENQERSSKDLQILDAFGGSGFLSQSFSHTPIKFTVADCTDAYGLRPNENREVLICNDYFREMASSRSKSYDLVFAHGGLHHVFIKNGTVECDASLGLQCHTVSNLGAMLRTGGLAVIGDVPKRMHSNSYTGAELEVTGTSSVLSSWIGETRVSFLNKLAQRGYVLPGSLRACSAVIESDFRNRHHNTSVRDFFDHFVANETVLGHEACFIDFPRLSSMLEAHGLIPLCRFAYPGAWIFSSREEAVWFFREMFGYGQTVSLESGIQPTDETVSKAIDCHLGTRSVNEHYSVNWGVTYSIYIKC